MCGIGGYYGPVTPTVSYQLAALWLALTNRGQDAAGTAWLQGSELVVSKAAGSPLGLLADRQAGRWRGSQYVLLHTRQATSGSILDNRNNHPIVAHGYVVTHNGVITNDHQLVPAKRAVTNCDSEAINWALSRWGPKGLRKLAGWAAVAWVSEADGGRVHLYTDGSPLVVRAAGRGVAWASTAGHLNAAGFRGRELAVKAGEVLTIGPDGLSRVAVGLPELMATVYYSASTKQLTAARECDACWHQHPTKAHCWCGCLVTTYSKQPWYEAEGDIWTAP